GPPVGCAAGLAVLDIIAEEDLCSRAVAIGERIAAWGRALQAETSSIGDVRAAGALAAIELVRDGEAARPDPELTRAIVARAARDGVLLLSCGARGNVIRFLPPLTIPEPLLEEGLAAVRGAVLELARERGPG